MEIKRKCTKCKSTNLTYTEEWEIRHWTWWQWAIGWAAVPAMFLLGLPVMGIPWLIYMIYCSVKKKKMIHKYVCQDCGYTKKV